MVSFRRNTREKRKNKHKKKFHWMHDEDAILITLVQRHGPGNWDYIANHIQGRSGKSCRLRWINQLNPNIDKTPFSQEEKRKLLQLHKNYGNRWSIIANFFPGRTDNQLKNQYHMLVGTRHMRALSPSSSSDPLSPNNREPIGLFHYGSMSTIPVGSNFSNVSSLGNYYYGFTPGFTAMPNSVQMTQSFLGGFSSVYGRDEAWLVAHSSKLSWLCPHSFDSTNLDNIHPQHMRSLGDSMISDASSPAFSELHPVGQAQQEVLIKDNQFIDFLGVETSK